MVFGVIGTAESRLRLVEPVGIAFVPGIKFARPAGWTGSGWVADVAPPTARIGIDRVLCLGDEATAGSGASGFGGWPAQVQERLGRDSVDVLNFAVPGWSVDQIDAALSLLDLGRTPDVLVWGTSVDDLHPTDIILDQRGIAPLSVSAKIPDAARVLPEWIDAWLLPRSAILRFVQGARYARAIAAGAKPAGGPEWYDWHLSRISEWSHRSGIPLLILAIPPVEVADGCTEGRRCAQLRADFATVTNKLVVNDLEWVDGLLALGGWNDYPATKTGDSSGLNAEAHARLAVAVAPAVRRSLDLAARSGRSATIPSPAVEMHGGDEE